MFKWVLGERAGKVISEWPEEVTLAAYVCICFPVSPLRLLAVLSWPLLAVLPCGQFSVISYLVSAVEKYSSKNGFPISKQIAVMRINVISLSFIASTNFCIIKFTSAQ